MARKSCKKMAEYLVGWHGGVAQAARCVGVSRTAFYAWLNGETSEKNMRALKRLEKAYALAVSRKRMVLTSVQHILKKIGASGVSSGQFDIRASYVGKDYVLTPSLLMTNKNKFMCFVAAVAFPNLEKARVWALVKERCLGG